MRRQGPLTRENLDEMRITATYLPNRFWPQTDPTDACHQ